MIENKDLRDPCGNKVPNDVACSIQMRCYIMANLLDKTIWDLAHACVDQKNRTKAEMVETMNEASKNLAAIKHELIGR